MVGMMLHIDGSKHRWFQIVIAIVLKPAMLAAVDVQHHSHHLAPRPPPAVWATPPAPPYQSGSLQRLLDPAIAQLDAMLLLELLVEVPHVEVKVLLLIQPQYIFAGL